MPWARFTTWVREAAIVRKRQGLSFRRITVSITTPIIGLSTSTVKRWWKRHRIKAGVTGLWICGQLVAAGWEDDLIRMHPRPVNPMQTDTIMREIVSHTYEAPDGQEKKISLQTLERYVHMYRSSGWDALLPSVRADHLQAREIAEDVLHKAIALKQEQPGRSVRQIIAILELAQYVESGLLKESLMPETYNSTRHSTPFTVLN